VPVTGGTGWVYCGCGRAGGVVGCSVSVGGRVFLNMGFEECIGGR